MFSNSLSGINRLKNVNITSSIGFPDLFNAAPIQGNIRYNATTKKFQFYDGSAWQTFDTSTGTNLWEVTGGTYIKPISSVTNGIKINNISPISGTNVYVDSDFVCQGIQSEGPFGASSWLTASFGLNGKCKVVMGTDPLDIALIGGHTSDLSAWAPLQIQRYNGVGIGDLYLGGTGSNVFMYSQLLEDTIIGTTTPNSGSLYGIPVTSSTISVDNIVFSPTTLRQYVNNSGSTGLLASPAITDVGDGSITVAAVNCQIRATNSSTAKIEFLPVTAATTPLVIPSDTTRYLIVSYNTGTPIYSLSTSVNTDLQTQILCAVIYRVPATESNELYINKNIATIINDSCKNFMVTTGQRSGVIKWQSGAALGFSTLQFNTTQGYFNQGVNNFSTVPKANGDSFKYIYHSSGVFVESTAQTNINITQYDNGTNLATITPTSRWSVQFVYATTDTVTRYYVIYATAIADSLSNALAIPLPTSIPSRLQSCGILLGKIVFQRSAATINQVLSVFSSSTTYQGITSHSDLANLTADDHTQYAIINTTPRSTTDYLTMNLMNAQSIGCNATNGLLSISSNGSGSLNVGGYNNTIPNSGTDVDLGQNNKLVMVHGTIQLPSYAFKQDIEGGLLYDYTGHTMKFYNGTTWQVVTSAPALQQFQQKTTPALYKGGKENVPEPTYQNSEDINIQRLFVDEIASRSKKGIKIQDAVLGPTTNLYPGAIGFDDMGAFVVTQHQMKFYFTTNDKKNNDHGVDPRTYTYLQKKFIEITQYTNQKIKPLLDEIKKLNIELEQAKKERTDLKNDILEIRKQLPQKPKTTMDSLSFLGESDLGNSINFVGN